MHDKEDARTRPQRGRGKWALAALAGLVLVGATSIAVVETSTASPDEVAGHPADSPWKTTAVPVDKGDLTAITALSETDVYAVGYRLTGLTQVDALLLHWDGTSWAQRSILPRNSFPQALNVRSATDIWAAGSGVAHWDGTTWTSYLSGPGGPPPPPGTPRPLTPDAVASAPDGTVWVAGRLMGNGGVKTGVPAISAWNGTAWVPQILPDGLGNGELTSLSVVSATDVWAAGSTFAATDADAAVPVLLHWDGTAWTKAVAPTVPGNATWFKGVTAFAANDVWAVGGTSGRNGDLPFAAHFDGTKWTVTKTPPVLDGRLRAVAKSARGEVLAAGGKGSATVALRWDGRSWQALPSPGVVLRGFATVPGSATLWAVGVEKDKDLVPVIARWQR